MQLVLWELLEQSHRAESTGRFEQVSCIKDLASQLSTNFE